MKLGFTTAMIGYLVLALIATLALDGKFRWAVLILLGGLAVRTLIARAAGW